MNSQDVYRSRKSYEGRKFRNRSKKLQGTVSGREGDPPVAGAASKYASENSGVVPPRAKPHASIAASADDVFGADENGRSPLHHAAIDGDMEGVRELIERGADTRLRDRGDMTPLHWALCDSKEAAAELLAEADSGNGVRDRIGCTPLHRAAEKGYSEVIRLLLAGGSGTQDRDALGRTPLHRALMYRKRAASELLARADSGNRVQDEEGQTPLHLAAENGYLETIRELLAGGSRTQVQDDSGRTPLHRALCACKDAAAELLVEADCGNQVRDINGQTPLHYAAWKEIEGTVRKFVQCGTNPHVRDNSGLYPIQLALRRCKRENVPKMLLSMYALKGIAIDWEELQLGENHLMFCVEALSQCEAEIHLMKQTLVPASSNSHHHLVTRHVSRLAPRLRIESAPGFSRSDFVGRNFPIYAHLITPKLQAAEERRVKMDRCLECLSHLSPPLPLTFTSVVLLCLCDGDMENLVCAFRLESCPALPQ